jgi:hypothetical protein
MGPKLRASSALEFFFFSGGNLVYKQECSVHSSAKFCGGGSVC